MRYHLDIPHTTTIPAMSWTDRIRAAAILLFRKTLVFKSGSLDIQIGKDDSLYEPGQGTVADALEAYYTQDAAHGRLNAASSDLLDACRFALNNVPWGGLGCGHVVDKLAAAVSKAEGRADA
ncbi:MAG: hypothetical protein LLG00_16615 [Planctomycetaceae bacterium]|nr:hypothetical protein [Planctomycetaceae bacterium]